MVLTCLLLAILCFFYSNEYIAETLILSSQHQLIAICFAIMVVYFLLKGLLYWSVNWIFFDRKKNEQWMKSQLFIFAMEGLALFPLGPAAGLFQFVDAKCRNLRLDSDNFSENIVIL